jgi:formylglycine-generating enzyme
MKINRDSLVVVLAFVVGPFSAFAQPAVDVAPAGAQSVLFWPSSATNNFVQSTTNLVSPSWASATDAVPVIAVTVSNASPARFFRLSAVSAGMALIPAGAFTMGDNLDGETDAKPTNVYVSAFYMEVNLVTTALWTNVYSYATNHGYVIANTGAGGATNHPVVSVDWYACVKWCNARSQQEGFQPCYYTNAALSQLFTSGANGVIVFQDLTRNGYRLPTEAEWEKAARGGLSGQRFPWGNLIGESQANYFGTTNTFSYDFGPNFWNKIGNGGVVSPGTSPVGSFPPNGYGLYDMAGNVNAWCWDWYASPYGQPTTNNPTGPAGPLTTHVVRGGDWDDEANGARCAVRGALTPIHNDIIYGFRCVRKF